MRRTNCALPTDAFTIARDGSGALEWGSHIQGAAKKRSKGLDRLKDLLAQEPVAHAGNRANRYPGSSCGRRDWCRFDATIALGLSAFGLRARSLSGQVFVSGIEAPFNTLLTDINDVPWPTINASAGR